MAHWVIDRIIEGWWILALFIAITIEMAWPLGNVLRKLRGVKDERPIE